MHTLPSPAVSTSTTSGAALYCCLNVFISFLAFQLLLFQGNDLMDVKAPDIALLANAKSLLVYGLVVSLSIASHLKQLIKKGYFFL